MKIEIRKLAPYLIICTAIIFQVLTIRQGHDWGGDSFLYIAHARNIIQGSPYAETGYIYNVLYASLSPETYPPVYPLLLAPMYKIFGPDLYAIRVFNLSLFMVFLYIFYLYSRDRLSYGVSRMGVLALVAFSPWNWDLKNSIISEFSFLAFFIAALILLDRIGDTKILNRRQVLLSIFAGIFIYLAYGTRSVGLLLMPALIVKDLINFRAIRRSTIIAVTVFIAGYLLQNIFLHSDKSYMDTLLLLDFQIILDNFYGYLYQIASYWGSGMGRIAQIIMAIMTLILATTGFGWVVRNRCSTAEMFLFIYIGVLMVWPAWQGSRFLIPIVPFAVLYLFIGIEKTPWPFPIAYKSKLSLGMIVLVAIFYIGSYSLRDFSDYPYGVEKKESQEIFDFVRKHLPKNSITIFRKPRVLALYTDKKSSVYPENGNPNEIWDYIEKLRATHLVVKPLGQNFAETESYLKVVQNYRDELELIFKNTDFEVYEIKGKFS